MKYTDFKVYDPVYVGIDKGIFEKHGVKVELTSIISGGPTAIQTVAGGGAHSGLSSLMAIINARAAGLPIVSVADIQSAMNGYPLEEWFVREDSGIESITDLKGKKIAINLVKSSFHYSLLIAMAQAGMKEDDVEFVLLPFSEQVIAMQQKQVDMIGLMQPHTEIARQTEGFKRILTATDIFGEKQLCCIFMNKVWAEENPDVAKKYVAGIVEAAQYIEEHPDEAAKIISKHTGVDESLIAPYKFQPNAMVNLDDCQYWLDYMLSRNDTQAAWLKVEDFATNSYNEKVK